MLASLVWYTFEAVAIVLVIVAGMLVRKLGQPGSAGRRFFLFLAWTGLGLLAAILIMSRLMGPNGNAVGVPLTPAASGVSAVAFLHLQDFAALRRRAKVPIFVALTLLAALMMVPLRWDTPQFLVIASLSEAALLAIVWALGKRYPAFIGLVIAACLALFNGLAVETLPLPALSHPTWLLVLSVVVLVALPGLVVATVVTLTANGLTLLASSGAPGHLGWKPAAGRLALALFLVAGFAFTLMRVSLWDGTDDGVGEYLLLVLSFLTAAAAGVVMGMHFTGWRRWLGLASPLLVAAGLSGALLFLGNSISHLAVTQARAARIQAAVDRFRATAGRYPAELAELVPGELWWIPKPVILRGEGWCYQGGADYYRLGAVYRDNFSAPLSVRVYASAGNPPAGSWTCDEQLAEQNARFATVYGTAPTPVPLPTGAVSTPRTPVQPVIRATSLVAGDWSRDGEYLIFGLPDPSGGQTLLGPDFLKADTGDICRASERKWATGLRSDGLVGQFAWLPDGRALYVADSGEMTVFRPCAPGGEDLASRYSTTFTQAAAYNVHSGLVLLQNQGAYWMLDGASLEARQIAGVTPSPDENWPARIAWSPGGERLSISRPNGQEAKDGSTVYIVDAAGGKVERSLPFSNTTDSPDPPVVDWLTHDELLVQGGGTVKVMDLRSDPPGVKDLIRDVFLLDAAYPNDFSSMDFVTYPADGAYYIGVRVNHPHNQAAYVYVSKTGRVEVFHPEVNLLLFLPAGQWLELPKFESPPTQPDDFDLVWLDQPGESRPLTVAGHMPRSQAQIFPKYLPNSSQLIFSSSQGVSLVSIPGGETVRFWTLAGGGGSSSRVYPAPSGKALVVAAQGDGLYYIPLPPGK